MKPLFTPEELAELKAFDAEVDASDITLEEMRESRTRERYEALAVADDERRKRMLYQKKYYSEHRERILSIRRNHYRQNRDAETERHRRYYQENRERCMAYQRAYRNRKKTIDKQGGQDNGKDD